MAKTILDWKHWQIWPGLILLFLITDVIADQVLMMLGMRWWTPESQMVSAFVNLQIFLIYPILAGNKLAPLSALYGLKRLSSKIVLMAWLLVMTVYAINLLMIDRIPAVSHAMAIIGFAGLLVLCSYPARQLKSIELRRDAGFWEYVPEIFQFLMWLLGIFWLQPRLNHLAEKATIARERSK